jgi:hypothetical protein
MNGSSGELPRDPGEAPKSGASRAGEQVTSKFEYLHGLCRALCDARTALQRLSIENNRIRTGAKCLSDEVEVHDFRILRIHASEEAESNQCRADAIAAQVLEATEIIFFVEDELKSLAADELDRERRGTR